MFYEIFLIIVLFLSRFTRFFFFCGIFVAFYEIFGGCNLVLLIYGFIWGGLTFNFDHEYIC